MTLQEIRAWIRAQVHEQHDANGGEINTKGIAHSAAFLVSEDEETRDRVVEDWTQKETATSVRALRSAARTVRGLLVPDGAGEYRPAAQGTLFELREFAARQVKTGATVARLGQRVLDIVDAALEAGADPQQRPEDVLTAAELEAVYQLRSIRKAA